MFNGMVKRFNVKTSKTDGSHFDGDLTLVIPCQSNETKLIIGLNNAIKLIDWPPDADAKEVKHLAVMDADKKRNRLNDGKADQKGRLWIGKLHCL